MLRQAYRVFLMLFSLHLLRARQVSIPPTPSLATESSRQPSRLFQLTVQPIVKSTVAQRDNSGEKLDDFVANGNKFQDIIRQLWEKFNDWIKAEAVKRNGRWTAVSPSIAEYPSTPSFETCLQYARVWTTLSVKPRQNKIATLIIIFSGS